MATSMYNALFTGSEAVTLAAGSTIGGGFAGTTVPINATASTLTVTATTHAGKIVTLNAATGIAVTMPNATGTGNTYRFFIGTTITSTNVTTFTRGTASDVYYGIAMLHKATSTYTPFLSASNSNVITLGTSTNTTGGTIGDWLTFIDVATNAWYVNLVLVGAGTLATPFSNA